MLCNLVQLSTMAAVKIHHYSYGIYCLLWLCSLCKVRHAVRWRFACQGQDA